MSDNKEKTDTHGALILDKTSNSNGNQYCWLNAPLYAFTAFQKVLDVYNLPCFDNKSSHNEDDLHHFKIIYELLLKSRDPDTIWNDTHYGHIHKAICNYTKSCGGSNEILALNQVGAYSNPHPIMSALLACLTKKCIDTPLSIQSYFINTKDSIHTVINNANIIVFILGTLAIDKPASIGKSVENKDKTDNQGHYVAYVRGGDSPTSDSWKQYDGGKTIEEYKPLNTWITLPVPDKAIGVISLEYDKKTVEEVKKIVDKLEQEPSSVAVASKPPVASSPPSSPVAVPPPRAVASKPLSIIEIMKELVSEPAPPPLPVAVAADPLSINKIMKKLVSEPANGATITQGQPTGATTIGKATTGATTTGATTTGATLTNEEVVEIIKQLNEVFSKVLGTGTGDGDGDGDGTGTGDGRGKGKGKDKDKEEEMEIKRKEEEEEEEVQGEPNEVKVQGEPNEVKVQILDQMVDDKDEVTSNVVQKYTIKVPPHIKNEKNNI